MAKKKSIPPTKRSTKIISMVILFGLALFTVFALAIGFGPH